MGNQNTLSAITTLAYDCRRSEYFTEHLYAALKLVDRGVLDASTRGAMHGEVGQTQFLPKSILLYGVDGDGDGSIDLNTKADALASTANFLKITAGFGARAISQANPIFQRFKVGMPPASIRALSPSLASRSMSKDGRRSANEALSRFRPIRLSSTLCNLGTGRNINNPNPRRRSARRAHRSFHGSAFAITTLRLRAAGLAERLRLLDFRIAGLMTVGGSVVISVATWTGVGPPMDERYSSRTQPRSLVTGSDT